MYGAQTTEMVHAGWRSRGYLPHYDAADMTQHVVFGLADAFPHEKDAPKDAGQRFDWRERHLNRGSGECLLRGEAADLVERALLHFDGERYALRAWCVMPNHVHVVLVTTDTHPLSRVVHSWKSFTANCVNELVARTGPLWRREYYDHYLRDEDEFIKTRAYVENNPVAAGFVKDAADWRWSSAWAGREAQ